MGYKKRNRVAKMDERFLLRIDKLEHGLIGLFEDDPVRPHIMTEARVSCGNYVYVLTDAIPAWPRVLAVTCLTFCNEIPTDESYIIMHKGFNPHIAVFYTIWSYEKGNGRELILRSVADIKDKYRGVKRFITLSPTTEVARKFHLSNGAIELPQTINNIKNKTINYEYLL